MKTTHCARLAAFLFVIALGAGCRKSPAYSGISSDQVAVTSVPEQMNFQCADPAYYGDSIIYVQPSGHSDYIINPSNAAVLGKGTYFSWPVGLMLDSSSGAIDLSRSEAGQRYVIGFVQKSSHDTCLSNLIVAGVSYVDSIYSLEDNDTLAIPYFNANASTPPVCNSSDDSDYPGNNGKGKGDNKCVFDGQGNNGKSGQANAKNVKVRTISGVINLKATVEDGAFGTNPVNGASITVPIYYSLNDKSLRTTQLINVQLMYFDSRSDIPAAVVNMVTSNSTAFFEDLPILFANPRPPLIVITRRN
ncbi:MAG: hypothetical protein Q8927_02875 [Bacteroidota bacterium]|nr:hypothetical protein [Bacteroidota bacterium]MDP4215117.1 hypothetical protein [Bacteroidota bacterium]MDP4254428.1 hypothetical protein [Bacteroidota bacterium]